MLTLLATDMRLIFENLLCKNEPSHSVQRTLNQPRDVGTRLATIRDKWLLAIRMLAPEKILQTILIGQFASSQ